MKLLFLLLSLFIYQNTLKSQSHQFILFDVQFTYSKKDADSSKPSKSHFYVTDEMLNKNRPLNWESPIDYRHGTVHIRLEVLNKPEGGYPTTWTLCYIPVHGQKNNYGCTGSGFFTREGIYDKEVSMTSFWENESIIWTEGIKRMDLVIKDDSGGQGHAHKRMDSNHFFPTTLRITMVQVPPGEVYDPGVIPAKAIFIKT